MKIFISLSLLFLTSQSFADSSLEAQMSEVSQLARSANSRPKGKGYKLQHVEPGSVYDSLGLKAGDVITGVKGAKISNPEKAMEMFQHLSKQENTNESINRNQNTDDKDSNYEN